MKRVFTFIALMVMTAGAVMAQPRAIGARLGYNLEVSYQHELVTGMLEIDAGASPFVYQKAYDALGNVTGTYHYGRFQGMLFYDWLANLTTDLYWYIGVGAGVSWGYGDFFDEDHYNKNGSLIHYNRLGIPAGAQIGLEYDFNIPLNLSIDWRPMINVLGLRQNDLTSNLLNVAIGIRYRF